ncbi:MAG TPA: hypothetical protein VIL65_15950 [Beijerinckiaceae bacterium]
MAPLAIVLTLAPVPAQAREVYYGRSRGLSYSSRSVSTYATFGRGFSISTRGTEAEYRPLSRRLGPEAPEVPAAPNPCGSSFQVVSPGQDQGACIGRR